MSFNDWLTSVAAERNSLLCVGLDPRAGDASALRDECFRLIDATADLAAAFKPNSAFFEACGAEGFAALRDVIAHVPAGIPVIFDAKRGDIADTSAAYARAAFDVLGAHAITLNPYVGSDALAPFLSRAERGAFVLCKTSNPGADELQAMAVCGSERRLFEVVAERAQAWNTNNNVALVVGATDPRALARVRALAPDLWLLLPGIGVQGGEVRAAVSAGLRADGSGLLLNASRSIAHAVDPRAEAERLRDEINRCRRLASHPPGVTREASMVSVLARQLVDSGCMRFGQFTLKSGAVSPIYLDLRRLVSHPPVLAQVARVYAGALQSLTFDRIAGIPYAALPIATAIALAMNRPLIYPRRESKDYGTRAAIEGDYHPGESVVVIDDLATTGDSKLETIQKLEGAGLRVRDVVVLIDREHGAREVLATAGYRLHALVRLRELLDAWQLAGSITPAQHEEVLNFLKT